MKEFCDAASKRHEQSMSDDGKSLGLCISSRHVFLFSNCHCRSAFYVTTESKLTDGTNRPISCLRMTRWRHPLANDHSSLGYRRHEEAR
eukprot:45074-Eustigmatos_ZCMA.PRE.1